MQASEFVECVISFPFNCLLLNCYIINCHVILGVKFSDAEQEFGKKFLWNENNEKYRTKMIQKTNCNGSKPRVANCRRKKRRWITTTHKSRESVQ